MISCICTCLPQTKLLFPFGIFRLSLRLQSAQDGLAPGREESTKPKRCCTLQALLFVHTSHPPRTVTKSNDCFLTIVMAMQSVQTGRGNTAQTGKKLVIRRNTQHADRSPLPLKLRCLKAVDEYNHRSRIRKDAQLRRHQVGSELC